MAGRVVLGILSANPYYSGQGKIIELVTQLGAPVSRRVRLYEAAFGSLVRTRWSNTNGVVEFPGLDTATPFILVAVDHTNTYDVVAIGDRYATATGGRP